MPAAADHDIGGLVGASERDRLLKEVDRFAPAALLVGVQPCFVGVHPGGDGLSGNAEEFVYDGPTGATIDRDPVQPANDDRVAGRFARPFADPDLGIVALVDRLHAASEISGAS